ncbi:MAG: hypothetical protein FJZ57_03625 [Chlamydiae bacterium]|nr:hypothetical protein [Chlamydiota bacterium]
MSIQIPSLQSLARTVVLNNLEKETETYYQGKTVSTVNTHSFSQPSILSRMYTYLMSGQERVSPQEHLLNAIPSSLLLEDSNITPRLLVAIEKAEPELYDDNRWKLLFENKWPSLKKPEFSSFRSAYIIQSLLSSLEKANYDAKRIPIKDLAFFTENASLCDGFEILDYSYRVDSKFLSSMINYTTNIKAINFRFFLEISQDTLEGFIKKNPQLESLHISYRPLNAKILSALSKYCKCLKSIRLSSLDDVNVNHLKSLFRANPNITDLIIGDCNDLNDESFKDLVHLLPNLKNLRLYFSEQLTPAILEPLFSNNRIMESITLERCTGFNDDLITNTKNEYPLQKLRIIEGSLSTEGAKKLFAKFKLQ